MKDHNASPVCEGCDYIELEMRCDGYCYMFQKPPEVLKDGYCGQHTGRKRSPQARRGGSFMAMLITMGLLPNDEV